MVSWYEHTWQGVPALLAPRTKKKLMFNKSMFSVGITEILHHTPAKLDGHTWRRIIFSFTAAPTLNVIVTGCLYNNIFLRLMSSYEYFVLTHFFFLRSEAADHKITKSWLQQSDSLYDISVDVPPAFHENPVINMSYILTILHNILNAKV